MPQVSSSSGTWLLKRGGVELIPNSGYNASSALWDDLNVTWDDTGF